MATKFRLVHLWHLGSVVNGILLVILRLWPYWALSLGGGKKLAVTKTFSGQLYIYSLYHAMGDFVYDFMPGVVYDN